MTGRARRGLARLAIAVMAPAGVLAIYWQVQLAKIVAALVPVTGPADSDTTIWIGQSIAWRELNQLLANGMLVWLIGGYFLLNWGVHGFGPIPRAERLKTRRLVLRRCHEDDLAAFHAIFSDVEALRHWGTPPHATIEETREWLDRHIEQDEAIQEDFAITRDGQVIGMLGATRLPTIGFILARSEWRQGYGFEALTAFTRYAFDRRNKHLLAGTFPDNQACIALLRKARFHDYYRGPDESPEGREIVAFSLWHPALRRRVEAARASGRMQVVKVEPAASH